MRSGGLGVIAAFFAMTALSGTSMAWQQPLTTSLKRDRNLDVPFQWGGVEWRIPKGFLVFKPPRRDELGIEVGLVKKTNILIPADVKGYDQLWEIHVRRVNNEDPRNGIGTIWRVGLPFSRLPQLASMRLNGMFYLGSSSGFHYFVMVDRDAYVDCHPVVMAASTSADILMEPLVCETTFHLPHGLYAWVKTYGIRLADANSEFSVIDDALRNFMN